MALEQWEIDLRNQLENSFFKEKEKETEQKLETVPCAKNDLLFYFSMILFFVLAALFILDFKTDFINKILKTKNIENVKIDNNHILDDAKINEIEEKIKIQEQKLFLLGIISNENNFIIKNNLNKKDIILLNKEWKLKKYPKHITFSEDDKAYLEKIQPRR